MRVSLIEADRLVIRKAVKILRKATSQKHKQGQLTEQFADWLGYFDQKQLVRQLKTHPKSHSEADLLILKHRITQWLEGEGLSGPDASVTTDRLNLSKLSAFTTPSKPTLIVYDEMHEMLNMRAKKRGDDISDLLARLNLPRYKWFTTEPRDSISDRNVIDMSQVIPRVRDLLELPEFSEIYSMLSPNREQAETLLANRIQSDVFPHSQVSAQELLANAQENKESIEPFGFRVVEGTLNNQAVWSLYHPSLHGFLPQAWSTQDAAVIAKAELIFAGRVTSKADPSLTGAAVFQCVSYGSGIRFSNTGPEDVHVEISGGLIQSPTDTAGGRHLLNAGPVREIITHVDLNALKPSYSALELLPFNKADSTSPIFPSVPASIDHLAPFLSADAHAALRAIQKCLQEMRSGAWEARDNADLSMVVAWLKEGVSDSTLPDEDLWVDDPVDLLDAFPLLAQHFSVAQLDEWHARASDLHGYRNRGGIYVSEWDLCVSLFWEELHGSPPSSSTEEDTAAICLGYLVTQESFNPASLLEMSNTLLKQWQAFNTQVNLIQAVSAGLSELEVETGYVCTGPVHTTSSDALRSGRKFNSKSITVTQSSGKAQ